MNLKNNLAAFTVGEFAKLHNLNKRTLQYYDDIGLFSPKQRLENGYRYYTYTQSMELENILALKELGMSIQEVKKYVQNPSRDLFYKIAADKIGEIDRAIERLKILKSLLRQKEEMLRLSSRVFDGEIETVDLEEEYLLMTPLNLVFEDENCIIQNAEAIVDHWKTANEICTYKKNCGSFLSVNKIQKEEYDEYDGIFTVLNTKRKDFYIKPKGKYIRGFSVGDWDKIPQLYKKIISFAQEHNLQLTGYAFEIGLNEFAISDPKDYVTQIEILCQVQEK